MSAVSRAFLDLIEKNVRFDYHSGASTWVTYPHTTNWRVLPSVVVSQIDFNVVLEQKDRKPIPIRSGQTSCVPSGLMHRGTMTSRHPGYSHWCHFQCEILQGVSLFYLAELPLVIGGKRSQRIGEIASELAKIHKAELSLKRVVQRQSLGWKLITTLLENASFTAERLDLMRNATRLTPVLAHIEENLGLPISHDLLARKAGLSPSRFHVLFRAALGSAPYQYVQKLRLKKAQQLLIRTDLSIAEVGRDVGHPDPYHFSRVFRRNIGISPAHYRKQVAPDLL